jgi:hypothetical protein
MFGSAFGFRNNGTPRGLTSSYCVITSSIPSSEELAPASVSKDEAPEQAPGPHGSPGDAIASSRDGADAPPHREDGKPAVNARDRIGKGPWQNAKGVVIAKDTADLHGAGNNLTKQTALSEKGEVINGRGDTPNRHDVLTGSQADGTAFAPEADRTCRN